MPASVQRDAVEALARKAGIELVDDDTPADAVLVLSRECVPEDLPSPVVAIVVDELRDIREGEAWLSDVNPKLSRPSIADERAAEQRRQRRLGQERLRDASVAARDEKVRNPWGDWTPGSAPGPRPLVPRMLDTEPAEVEA